MNFLCVYYSSFGGADICLDINSTYPSSSVFIENLDDFISFCFWAFYSIVGSVLDLFSYSFSAELSNDSLSLP